MGLFTKLSKIQLQELLSQFKDIPKAPFKTKGIGMGTVNTYYKITFHSPQKVYFLKIDEIGDEKRLKNEIEIFKSLKKQSQKLSYIFPFPIKTLKNKYYLPYKKKFVLLFPQIPGKSIFKNLNQQHIYVIGQKMAELHKLKLSQKISHHRFNLNGMLKSYKTIQSSLADKHPKIKKWMDQEFKQIKENHPKKAKTCLIHADLFPENIHWKSSQFLGMLDFEASGKGSALYDICVAFHALCHNGKKWNPSLIEQLINGYKSQNKINSKTKITDPPLY